MPMASVSNLGIVRANTNYGININSNTGELFISGSIESDTKTGTSAYKPITPRYQHASVFYGLSKVAGVDLNGVSGVTLGTYTNEAKTAIKAMLGVQDGLKVVRLI